MTFCVAFSNPSRYLVQPPSLCSHPRDPVHKCRSFACRQRSQSHTGSQAQSSSGLTSLSVQHERLWYQPVDAGFRGEDGWHARVVKRQLRTTRKALRQDGLSGDYVGRPDFSRVLSHIFATLAVLHPLLILIYLGTAIGDTQVLSLFVSRMQ